ncbi:hypothetical protein [Rhizobium sp. GN54]|uniref:hypothetical protein n=1 Tax=Rhizobium sp. GN54 TaxID=2898150 RepID=UPI001E5EB3D0|nr:hypothetical protein [Rhizobium sp. GN54]MCD2181449.1 hypothetical protein [Rhizobium sp. GN54]
MNRHKINPSGGQTPLSPSPSPERATDRRPADTASPGPGMLALRHIGLRLGITVLIAGAIQMISNWSAG